jgi:lantibiotic biosynthesis protein
MEQVTGIDYFQGCLSVREMRIPKQGFTSRPDELFGWHEANFFVLRTPFLPFDELLALGEGLEAMGKLGEVCLPSALNRDLQRVRTKMLALCSRADIREAIFIASPSLEECMDNWKKDPESASGQKIELSLLRYLLRMAGRSTPFGLFSGITVVNKEVLSDERTCLRLQPRSNYQRHTRADVSYISTLTEQLHENSLVRKCLKFSPNSSLYKAGGEFRYTEARKTHKGKLYYLVSVELTSYLQETLHLASIGTNQLELAEAICVKNTDVDFGEAQHFVEALITHEILVSELTPIVTGLEPIDDLLKQIQKIEEQPAVLKVATILRRVQDLFATLDKKGLGIDPSWYRDVATKLETVDISRFFQVDLVKPPAFVSLGCEVITEMARGVDLLHQIGSYDHRDPFQKFRKDFERRYGDREVALCETLDEEAGIEFKGLSASLTSEESLLQGLNFPNSVATAKNSFGERDELLLQWLSEALLEGRQEILLGHKELDALAKIEAKSVKILPLPDSFSVISTILAGSEEAIENGRYRILLSSVSGPSGANFLGRFCHNNKELTEQVRSYLRDEEALQPNKIFAEIVHLPQSRTGNILLRPQLRNYEIPYLGRSGCSPEYQIPLTDLFISVKDDRVVLRSKRLNCEIIPRLTTAHNFESSDNLSMYRFLCCLQKQGVASYLSFSFGALSNAPFLPRVVCGRFVLTRACWNLSDEQINSLLTQISSERFTAMQAIRHQLQLPRWIAIVDGDKQLPVDLDNILCVEAAIQLLKSRSTRKLVELFYGDNDVFASSPEGRFVHELVVPFLRANSPSGKVSSFRSFTTELIPQSFPPGSEWLYIKLYTAPNSADLVLRKIVRPIITNALSSGVVDSWFFIRYSDPDWHIRLRLHGDKKLMLCEILPELLAHCSFLKSDNILWRLQLDTYEREMQRYGGPAGIILTERLFHADSDSVLDVLETIQENHSTDARWHFALIGIDRLLEDLGLDLAEKCIIVRAAREHLGKEFQVDRPMKRKLSKRYRQEYKFLATLLSPNLFENDGLSSVYDFTAFSRRSLTIQPIIAELRESERMGYLNKPFIKLAGSYIHMHTNRILRSATRAQELVLYDFLSRLYKSQAAQQSMSSKPS